MLLEFLEGKKRTLTSIDFLDLVEKYDNEIIVSQSGKNNKELFFIIEGYEKDKYAIYSKDSLYQKFVIFVDELNKRIYVDKEKIFYEINKIYIKSYKKHLDTIILHDKLGEFSIIDIHNCIFDINRTKREMGKEYLISKKDYICDKMKSCDIDDNIDDLIDKQLFDSFIKNKPNNIPLFFNEINLDNLSNKQIVLLIEEFCYNKDYFKTNFINKMEEIIDKVYYLTNSYIYFIVEEKLKNNDIPEKMLLAKKIQDAILNGGKNLKVSYINKNSKEETISCVNNLYGYDFKETNHYNYINIDNVTKITFGKKVLYSK